MALRIGSFEIEIGLGYLDIRAGRAWDLYWNHLHREFSCVGGTRQCGPTGTRGHEMA
jgi:hypothetical protein